MRRALSMLVLLLAMSPAHAAWSPFGDVVVGSDAALTLSSAYDDETPSLSGRAAVDIAAVESAAGVSPYALDLPAGEFATEGSAAARRFTVSAGDVLRFDWRFTTAETQFLDHAFVVIGGRVQTLATRLAPGGATPLSFSQSLTRTGEIEVAFGVVDTGDVLGVSTLAISGFAISPVPEPAAAVLLLTGLALLARRSRDGARSPACDARTSDFSVSLDQESP